MTDETETQTTPEMTETEKPSRPRRPRRTRRPRRSEGGEAQAESATTEAPEGQEAPEAATAAPDGGNETPQVEVSEPVETTEPASPEGAPKAEPKPVEPPPPPVYAEGIVEVSGKGFGFLREPKRNFTQSNNDVFVTPEVIRKHGLRDGMWIKGETRRGPRGPQLYKLTELEHEDPEKYTNLPVFEELTTVSPDRRIVLETEPHIYTTRVIDLIAPVGRGTRGLIVAPPRTGKTTLLQHIAAAVAKNYPEIKLIILLVDERPEEVTEIRRSCPTAEVMASSNDCDNKTHTRISQLAIERAKRLVEMGKDVFVLMDSLTRIGRAFNNAQGRARDDDAFNAT